ncbi:hypothetical protein OEG84_16870 [Hoeflea sp. G2-23]|uniref:Uncharacterized protein n=1 Tax=Hoeflea algicola TaxID=2983763 RepID=A0ABT3ZC32_9HYPH|nr:hypothetical protein [Hoeflea algicola]MCY0149335.1 hypothetical protein [Hoeflea algicola]
MADKTNTYSDEGLQPDGAPTDCAPALSIDWEFYGTYLDESDLSDDQKREFIETLWSIAVSFVDLGFGIAPVQTGCEQNANSALRLPDDLLSLDKDIPQTNLEPRADETPSHPAEREES